MGVKPAEARGLWGSLPADALGLLGGLDLSKKSTRDPILPKRSKQTKHLKVEGALS